MIAEDEDALAALEALRMQPPAEEAPVSNYEMAARMAESGQIGGAMADQRTPSATLSAQMDPSAQSDVTARVRRESMDTGGGFDWARGLFAAGGGNLSAFDADRERQERAPYERAAALQENFDREATRQMARQAMDPLSQVSKQKQAEYANEMDMRAAMHAQAGQNELAQRYADEAKRANTMSASQIASSAKMFGGLFADSVKMSEVAAKREAMPYNMAMKEREVAARELQARNTGAQGWARIQGDEQERELRRNERADAVAAKKEAATEARNSKLPSGEQVAKYNQRKVAANEVAQALQLLPSVTYTGAGAETANWAMSKDPTGMLDKRSEADKKFVGILNSLRAKARNQIFGAALSKYDIADAESFLASLGTNKTTIAANLERLLKATQEENQMEEGYYPGLVQGQSRPSGGSDPRVELAKKALADPNASPEHKAAAQRILDKAGAQ